MPRLLCIEDDPDTCELLVEVLTAEGFTVSTVASGEAGLSALETRPDLVLCDIDLPDVSGFDILCENPRARSAAGRCALHFSDGVFRSARINCRRASSAVTTMSPSRSISSC